MLKNSNRTILANEMGYYSNLLGTICAIKAKNLLPTEDDKKLIKEAEEKLEGFISDRQEEVNAVADSSPQAQRQFLRTTLQNIQ